MSEANHNNQLLKKLSKDIVEEVAKCLAVQSEVATILQDLVKARRAVVQYDLRDVVAAIDSEIISLPNDGDEISLGMAKSFVMRYLSLPFLQLRPHIAAPSLQRALKGKPLADQLNALKRVMQDELRLISQERDQLSNSNSFDPLAPMNAQNAQMTGQQDNPFVEELREMEEKIKETKFSPEAREKVEKEFKKLTGMNPQSADAEKIRDYLGHLLDYPWGIYTDLNSDIASAKKILDEDHYGLKKAKEEILDSLVSQARVGEAKAPIICFVGPPGTGKTSLAKSVARATGRKSVRLSVGGMTDETNIRGHRRTYVGSMPGQITSSMAKAKSSNPLFIIDEIDKLGRAQGGSYGAIDSALLEVLDPEQNDSFGDRYFDVPVDLSRTMFVVTANNLSEIPPALRDRVEVVEFSGYLTEDKMEIAKRYLLPDVIEETGIKPEEISISDDALLDVIEGYTREAGARQLKRKLKTLCQKALREVLAGEASSVHFTKDNLTEYLGKPLGSSSTVSRENQVGIGHGLAWTAVGGKVLPVEVGENYNTSQSRGISATGNIGKVMKESVQVAFNLAMKKADKLKPGLKKEDIGPLSVHFPGGAVPKDGPSAGIVLTTAIASKITGLPVRGGVAMTGEVTSMGEVRAIGGLAYKLQAAANDGAKTVIIPKGNEKDLEEEVPSHLKDRFNEIVLAETIDDVLDVALVQENKPANDVVRQNFPGNRDGVAP
ncbi:MAG: endopeptidase La [Alphaproteobacteria bacterium]|nr:endopeptidase La [Alphaproteobacteria bacterium]